MRLTATTDNANHQSVASKQMAETANYLMLRKEVKILEHLLYGPHTYEPTSQEWYTAELAVRIETVHNKLRSLQLLLRTTDLEEEYSFKVWQQI